MVVDTYIEFIAFFNKYFSYDSVFFFFFIITILYSIIISYIVNTVLTFAVGIIGEVYNVYQYTIYLFNILNYIIFPTLFQRSGH